MRTLTRLECKKIRMVAEATAYNTTKEGSKLAGKKYITYQLDGIRFTMNEEETFNALHASGKLAEVDIEDGVRDIVDGTGKKSGTKPTIAIINWLSHEDVINDKSFDNYLKLADAKVEAKIAVYKREAVAEYEELA